MSQSNIRADLRDELRNAPVEPLLPIEKKLIVNNGCPKQTPNVRP